MSTDPTAEHIDAVARALLVQWNASVAGQVRQLPFDHCVDNATAILTSTDPAVHAALAASLPAEVMLAALVDRGTLTERIGYRDPDGGVWQPEGLTIRGASARGMPVVRRYEATGWIEVAL